MKIHIDREDCTSCGTCWETCPAFFEMKEKDGFSQVIEEFRLNKDISRGTPPGGARGLCP